MKKIILALGLCFYSLTGHAFVLPSVVCYSGGAQPYLLYVPILTSLITAPVNGDPIVLDLVDNLQPYGMSPAGVLTYTSMISGRDISVHADCVLLD